MSEPIRILVAILGHKYGGTENLIFQLYKYMDRSMVQMDFLTYHDLREKVAYEDEINAMGGRVFRSYYSLKEKKDKNYISPYSFLKKHPEISGVHFHANYITTQYRILLPAFFLSKKIRIIHSHNVNYQSDLSYKDKFVEILAKCTMGFIPTNMLACSLQAGRWMFGEKKFQVLNNGIDVGKFLYNKTHRYEVRGKYGLSEEDYIIGTVGRLEFPKNPLFMINLLYSLRQNKNVKMIIVGEGPLRQAVEHKIQQLGLTDRIFLPGVIKEPAAYYSAFDLFIFPSEFEGFGISLLEAQASGVHCISSNTVPVSTNILGNVKYIPLDLDIWTNVCINHIDAGNQYDRNIKKEKFDVAGFDIRDSALKLQNMYLNSVMGTTHENGSI